MNPLDYLLGGVTPAAQSATNAALDTAAARPFNVIITIDPTTKTWLSLLAVAAMLTAIALKKG